TLVRAHVIVRRPEVIDVGRRIAGAEGVALHGEAADAGGRRGARAAAGGGVEEVGARVERAGRVVAVALQDRVVLDVAGVGGDVALAVGAVDAHRQGDFRTFTVADVLLGKGELRGVGAGQRRLTANRGLHGAV